MKKWKKERLNVQIVDGSFEMDEFKLGSEEWREYDFEGRVYRIDNPLTLVIGETTHRVVDNEGVVHCVPTVGRFGCVLRWKVREGEKYIQF